MINREIIGKEGARVSDGLYEIFALAARYFFAGLFLLIVLRAWRVTVRDARRAGKLRRLSPQTGLSGELVVLEGEGRARRGMRYPVIREGTLGSARSADMRVRHPSVRPRHARFELTEEGLSLTAAPGAKLLDGEGERARKLLLRDGDCFTAGSVTLTLVLIDATGRSGDYAGQEDELFTAPRPPRNDGTREGYAPRPDEFWREEEPLPDAERPRAPQRSRRETPRRDGGRARPSGKNARPGPSAPRAQRPAPRARDLFFDDDLDEDNF